MKANQFDLPLNTSVFGKFLKAGIPDLLILVERLCLTNDLDFSAESEESESLPLDGLTFDAFSPEFVLN